jgi:hypothetical protein
MKLHLTMKSGLIVATVGLLFTVTPAASQGRGTQKACRQETMEACVKRQMAIRDPVSGVAIQRDDAERFCNRKSQRC